MAGSNLVKAAVFGADPNWGRIICAIGYSGAILNSKKVDIFIGPVSIVKSGLPDIYSEPVIQQYMEKNNEIRVDIILYEGKEEATAWGCDLTYDYVKINALYRT